MTKVLDRHFDELTTQVDHIFKTDSDLQQLDKFKNALSKQIISFSSLEDSIYTNRAMRTVIKFKAEDILSKTNIAHTVNQ